MAVIVINPYQYAAPIGPEPDEPFENVSLLLYGNDLTDSSLYKHALNNTNIAVNTTTKKYGFGSLYFNSGAYGKFPHDSTFDIGTGDFTIEAWVYPQSSGVRGIAHNHPSFTGGGFTFWIGGDSKLRIENFINGNSVNNNIVSTTTVPNGTWAHVAYSRSGGTGYLFVNGNLEGTHTDSTNLTNNSAFYIGVAQGIAYRGIGYIDDLRFTVGEGRYTSGFTPPASSLTAHWDPYFDEVSLMLHGDGTNNSTTFTDSSLYDHTISRYGNAKISTAQSKFGGSSMYFDGNGDYLSLPNDQTSFDFGTGKFTIECWIYNQGTRGNIFSQRHAYDTNNTGMTWRTGLYNDLVFWYGNGLGSFGTPNASLPANVWNHVALTRNGNTFTIWINGQARATNTITASMIYYPPAIGRAQGVAAEYFNGYIDDFRVTKGVARYTADFDVPQRAFPEQFGTPDTAVADCDVYADEVSLLLRGDGTNNSTIFTDSSSNSHSITRYGNAKISTTQFKFGGSSMYFDGSGDYLTVPDDTSFHVGSGDFTIECWIYRSSAVNMNIINKRPSSAADTQWLYFQINSTGTLRLWATSNSSTWDIANGFNFAHNTLSTGQWHHVALVRSGTEIAAYVDGTKATNTITTSASIANGGTNTVQIAGDPAYNASYVNGYIDDFRITKGVARYTASFVPPTIPLPL